VTEKNTALRITRMLIMWWS